VMSIEARATIVEIRVLNRFRIEYNETIGLKQH
jgi:hypothetical protein